jgi:phage-related protein
VAGELPPVLVDFIANVRDIIGPLNDVIEKLQVFQAAVDRATTTVREFGDRTVAAGAEADSALRGAANAAQNAADAEAHLAGATQAAADEANKQADAAARDALALEAQAAELRHVEDAAYRAAAAQMAENAAAQENASIAPSIISAMNKIAAAQDKVAQSAHNAAAATSFWSKHFQLSGGLFGTAAILGTVSGIELVLHSVMEFLAVFIPAVATATIGLLAWGAAAYQAGQQVFYQFKNASTVGQALNQTIAPLRGNFQALQNAVRPQVFELLGEYMDMSSHSTGVLNKLIQQTGTFLDHLFARLEVHSQMSGGKGLAAFFDAGIKDLQLFGVILGNLGSILMRFAQAAMQTHIAEILLGIFAAASQFLTVLNKIPAPLLTMFVAFHGIALWGGLAVTQLRNLALVFIQMLGNIGPLNSAMTRLAGGIGATTDQIAKMGGAAPALKNIAADIANGVPGAYQMAQAFEISDVNLAKLVSKTPEVEVVAKALGVGAQDVANFATAAGKSGVAIEDLAIKTAGSSGKLTTLTKDLESGAQNAANLALAFLGTGKSAMGAEEAAAKVGTAFAESGTKAGFFAKGLAGIGAALPGGPVAWLIALGVAIAGVGVYLGMMPDKTQRWINSLNQSVNAASNINILGTTVAALAANTSQLANAQKTATGNVTELANNQADLSGKLQTELQHVGGLQKAYGITLPQALALLQTAGVKANDLFTKQGQVWRIDTEMVHGLISGYQAMGQQLGAVGSDMNVLLVSESSQLKAMQSLNQAWDAFTTVVAGPTTNILTLAQGLGTFSTDAAKAGASMLGLSANAVTLQQQFQTVYGNVQQTFDAFRSAQAVSGGLGNFTQFVKDAVASLIPLAGQNKAAAAEISALAQEAGGPASTNLSALSHWAGKVKDPLLQMYNASMKATAGASNLNRDAALLSNTLQSDLNPSLTQATMTALGGQKTLSAFADDLIKLGPKSAQTIAAGKQVAEMFLSIDKNSKSAEAQFVGWAESMGLTAAQATNLWDKVSAGEKPMTAVRDQLAKTAEAVTNLGKPGLWGQIEHAFMAAWDGVFNWFKSSLPHAMEVAWNAVSAFFTSTIPRTWNSMWGAMIAPVTRVFSSIKSTIMGIFDPWWKSHNQEMVTVAKAAWTAIHTVISAAWTAIMAVFHAGASAATVIWRQLWSDLVTVAKVAWAVITTVTRDALTVIEGVFRTAWSIIAVIVSVALNTIKTIITTIFSVILGVIGVALDAITGHWSKAWNDMKSITSTAFHAIVSIITNIASGFGTLLLSAGQAIVQGLINGIQSMAGAAMNAIQSIGSSMWNAAKSFFGFGSPSKLFTQAGIWLIDGLTIGIGGSAGKVLQQMKNLALSLTAAMRHAIGPMQQVITTQMNVLVAQFDHYWHILHMKHLAHLRAMGLLPGILNITSPASASDWKGSGVIALSPGVVGGAAANVQTLVIHQDIKVNGKINEQTLFTFIKQESYRYNIRNSGIVTGTLKPGMGI